MPTDLWRFAQSLYARPGVASACLRLQDGGADVCLLLCGAWLERRGLDCTAPRLQQLLALAVPWQEQVIMPLRRLRQAWRTAAGGDPELDRLREQVKALELDAERQLLLRLESLVQAWPEQPSQNESGPWLERLAPAGEAACRDALQLLRAAADSA
ncbi:MAG TPA: TIGR02444 family protein [Pseudomonas sp.]|nr:TIGR02444 family protein [Pseudomonas sp.]